MFALLSPQLANRIAMYSIDNGNGRVAHVEDARG